MIQINLPSDIEQKLRERAAQAGQDISTVIVEALREKVNEPSRLEAILGAFRSAFAQSGCSDEELDAAVESARDEIWQAKPSQ
jgi:hypothetical protein